MAMFICSNCDQPADSDDGCGEVNGESVCVDCQIDIEDDEYYMGFLIKRICTVKLGGEL